MSEKLKTVLELYNLEIHHKKAGPDYNRLKTMVKRSIEQNLRMKNFEARNGNYETSAVGKNQSAKQREQRSLGDRWQWKANGQCSKGDNCSFCHDIHKRGKMTQPNPSPSSFMQENERNASRTRSPRGKSPSGRMFRLPCKDYLIGTCTNSFCEKWHPPECLFYKTKSGCRFGEKCSYAHRHVDEQPSKRSKKNGDKSAVAMLKKHESYDRTHQVHDNWVAFSRLWSRRTETDPTCKIHESRCTSRGQSRPKCPGEPHQRSPHAQKFEHPSQEETDKEPVKQRGSWPKVF